MTRRHPMAEDEMTIQTHLRSTLLMTLVACGVALLPAVGSAQESSAIWPAKARTSLFGPNPFGNVEVGVRNIGGDTRSSKFQEYRQIPEGVFLGRLYFSAENADKTAFLEFRSREVRERDQNFFLAAGLTRTVRLEVEWDEVPHTFSTTGSTVFSTSGNGVFTVNPAVRPGLVSAGSVATFAPAAAVPQELGIRQNTGRAFLRLTPSTNWDVRLQYADEKQTGTRPFGVTFAFNPNELPEPIDYRTHQFSTSAEYAREGSVIQVGYNLSLFRNRVPTLTWENPFVLTDTVGNPSMGQLDLYPNNDAHNLSVTAATKLPLSGRVAATVSTGWMLQNDQFLPFTINTALAPLLPALPARSLDGRIRTVLMNYGASMRPAKRVTLTGRYRLYDLNNQTPALIFSSRAAYDTSVSTDARRNVPYAYSRQNGGVDLSVQLARGVSAKALFEREVWNREHREVEHNADNSYGGALDVAPNGWLNLRTSYRRSIRRTNDYDAERTAHFGFPFGETGLGQLEELRKFDQADRDRDRVDGIVQITPLEALSFGVSYGVANDDFVNSDYGLLFNKSNTASFDVSYSPVAAVAFYAEYGRELYKYAMQSRYRVPTTATAAAIDFPRDDWRRDMRDRMETWSAGVDTILAERLNANVSYSQARATGVIHTRTLDPLAIAAVASSAVDYPDTLNRLRMVMSSVRYRLRTDLAAKLEYIYENYAEVDFANDVMQPIMTQVDSATTRSFFLGARQPGYHAHVVVLALQYRF